MRRLILFRHAKSDWPDGVSDQQRPLAGRGRDAAPRMGAYLAAEHLIPDYAIVSSARRARETWELAAAALGEDVPLIAEPRLYNAKSDAILAVIRETEPSVHTLIVVGHNPGFEELAQSLVGHGDRYAFARLDKKYPTAGLAVIDFMVDDWAEVEPHGGRLDRFITPRMLGGDDD